MDGTREHGLLAAECEELPGEAGCPERGVFDVLQIRARIGGDVGLAEQNASVTCDDGEDVVEIMRDPGGKLTDGVKALTLLYVFFEIQSLGEILS